MLITVEVAELPELEISRLALQAEVAIQVPWRGEPVNYACRDESCKLLGAIEAFGNGRAILITSLWVADAKRRLGIGTALIDRVRLHAKSCQARDVFVTCMSGTAEKFYTNRGFKCVFRTSLTDTIEFVLLCSKTE